MTRAGKIQYLKDLRAGKVKYDFNLDAMTTDELLWLSSLHDRFFRGGQIANDEKERGQVIENRIGLVVSEYYDTL